MSGEIKHCKSCHAEIEWIEITTKEGQKKWHPVNPGKLITVVTKRGYLIRGLESHYATCPDAKQWRERKVTDDGTKKEGGN